MPSRKAAVCPLYVSFFAALAALLFAGCESMKSGGDVGFYIVSVPQTAMFRYGPAQSFGADFNLKQGQRVVMMRREYGYSRVMTDEGQSGYVATEDLSPAPPVPKTSGGSARGPGAHPMDFSNPPRGRNSGGPSSANSNAVLQGGALFGAGDLPPLPERETTEKPRAEMPKPEFRFPKPKPGFRVNVPAAGAAEAEKKE